jgi:glucokinase
VIAAGELLLAPARAEAVRRALPTMSAHAQVVPAQFGTEAGLVGAAALALDGAQRSVA